ncbi:MAG: SCO family protein [Thiotrichaceae bacterium]
MNKILIPVAIIALLLGLIVGNYFWKPAPAKSGVYVDPPGGNFTLQSHAGPISLDDYKGKVVLMYFGYTFCPDVCPTSLARISGAFKKLTPAELEQVKGILISVDPDRDTPEKLAEYTKFFHPNIVGVTGTKAQIDEVTERYDVIYRKAEGNTAAGYLVDHTSFIYVLDKKGKISEFLPHAVPVDGALAVIRKLLQE